MNIRTKDLILKKRETLQTVVWVIIFICIMTLSFYSNILHKNDGGFFEYFQKDSEVLTVGKILADNFDVDSGGFGLGHLTGNAIMDQYSCYWQSKSFITDANWINGVAKNWAGFYLPYSTENEKIFKVGRPVVFKNGDKRIITRVEKRGNSFYNVYLTGEVLNQKDVGIPFEFKIYNKGVHVNQFYFSQYKSSYGLQGRIFSIADNKLNLQSLDMLRLMSATLLSIVLVCICYLLVKPFGLAYAAIFYIVFLLSPWVTAFARNLFWVPFTWFLPMLISLLILRNMNKLIYFLPLMYTSILVKSLCGYEYITTIMLSAISFLVIELFRTEITKSRKKIIISIIAVGIVSLFGFFTALLIHANMRGDSLVDGLIAIWREDVLRRVIGGDAADFAPVYKYSLEVSTFTVIKTYISHWHTDVIFYLNGKDGFPILLIASAIILIFNCIRKQGAYLPDVVMYLIFFVSSVSWFILGKPHSFIHVHMNYVLWYFGFIQYMLYVCLKFCKVHNNIAKSAFGYLSREIKRVYDSL